MLKDSLATRLFIRACITGLKAIGPLSVAYIPLRLLATPISFHAPYIYALDVYCASETLFLLCVHLPRKWLINRPLTQTYAPLRTRVQRREMLQRMWDATPEPRRYVEMYFYGAPLEALGREDVRRFLKWRLWGRFDEHGGEGKEGEALVDEGELEEYVRYTEEVLEWRFEGGATGNESMAVMVEPVKMVRRPLLWYGIIGLVDTIAFVGMWWRGFGFYGRRGEVVRSFPFRPLALFGRPSPTDVFGYWYREHTTKAKEEGRLPVLFVHGIGVGQHFYLPFFKELMPYCRDTGVGLIALEVLPVSNRMTSSLPTPDEVSEAVVKLLDHHGWEKCVLVTHSYGSAITAHMMRHTAAKARIGPMIFVDPVAFSFHPPDVAWNFLRRKPRTASEWQLWYFASMDSDVARTLTRNFRWLDSSLWREDLEAHRADGVHDGDGRVSVFVSGADIITDVNTLGEYLTRRPMEQKWYQQRKTQSADQAWMEKAWAGTE